MKLAPDAPNADASLIQRRQPFCTRYQARCLGSPRLSFSKAYTAALTTCSTPTYEAGPLQCSRSHEASDE